MKTHWSTSCIVKNSLRRLETYPRLSAWLAVKSARAVSSIHRSKESMSSWRSMNTRRPNSCSRSNRQNCKRGSYQTSSLKCGISSVSASRKWRGSKKQSLIMKRQRNLQRSTLIRWAKNRTCSTNVRMQRVWATLSALTPLLKTSNRICRKQHI